MRFPRSRTKSEHVSPVPATEAPYGRIGGAPAVRKAVDMFYELVLADKLLAPYFAKVSLPQLKRHQAALLTKVLGGPDSYTGRDMTAAHAELRISDAHFQRVANYLTATLYCLHVPGDIITQAGEVVESLRSQIVTNHDSSDNGDLR